MRALARMIVLASAVLSAWAQSSPQAVAAEHARAAQEAERRDDFPTAVREYEQVAKLFPQNASVQSNLGVALYFNHELQQALATLRKAIALDASLLAPHLFSGLAWYRLSNPDAAVPELVTATRLSPSDVLSHTWLGYAYTAQFQYDLALAEFQIAGKLDPANLDVWYALGQTYLQIGRDSTAKLLAEAPNGARVWQFAGEQAELQGDRQKAIEDYETALRRRPDLSEIRDSIARLGGTVTVSAGQIASKTAREDELYRKADDAEKQARQAFEHVAGMAPDSYRTHQILGDSLTAEGKADEANTEYRAVLNQKPDLPGIHEAIGKSMLRTGKVVEALTEFYAEIALEPRSASAHTRAGEALLLLGKDAEARKMLTSAQQMDRPPADLYRLVGKLDLRAKDFRSAADALTRYIVARKDDASAYYLLAKAYAGLGDREQASRALVAFEKTSRDAKARSRAETELAHFSNPTREGDEKSDGLQGPGR